MALGIAVDSGEVQPAPRGSMVPESLRVILWRGLAPDPDQRWPSMEALMVELRALVATGARRGSVG